MGLLVHLIMIPVHIFFVGMDVLFLFALAKMASYRWHPQWLMAVNSTGEPLMSWFTGQIERLFKRLHINVSSERTLLFIGMLSLCVTRFAVTTLFNWQWVV